MDRDNARVKGRVGLLVTCLVDLFRPNIGFAAVKLIEQCGFRVEVPESQTCCGQPAYNSGDEDDAKRVARQVIEAFGGYDYVVAPSGSCAGMVKVHYPRLFRDDPSWRSRAEDLAQRTYELTSFLTEMGGSVSAQFDGKVTYHDSCSGLRELGIKRQPRALLGQVLGLSLEEMEESEVCCGFGGTFCIKYPKISERMVGEKTAHIGRAGVGTVLGGDLGCLLNITGRLRREGDDTRVFHVAEVLADMASGPGIGDKVE